MLFNLNTVKLYGTAFLYFQFILIFVIAYFIDEDNYFIMIMHLGDYLLFPIDPWTNAFSYRVLNL